MKRKLLIALVIAVLVCSALSLVGCKASFKDVYDLSQKEYNYSYTTLEDGYQFANYNGELRLFSKYDSANSLYSYKLFNGENLVKTYLDTADTKYTITLTSETYFKVKATVKVGEDYVYYFSAYTKDGTALFENSKNTDYMCSVNDAFAIVMGKYYFTVKDGAIDVNSKKEFGVSNVINILPSINYVYNDYYYYTPSSSVIVVYDKNFELCAFYQINTSLYGAPSTFGILSNGNVLAQVKYKTDITNNNYTYADSNGNKYIVKNIILDIKSNTTKYIDSNYILVDDIETNGLVDNGTKTDLQEYGLNSTVKNITFINKIENKVVSKLPVAVTINDNGSYTEIPTAIKNQSGLLEKVDNLFGAANYGGCIYIVDKDGKAYGPISIYASFVGGCIINEEGDGIKVYDTTLNGIKSYLDTDDTKYYYDNSNELIIETKNQGKPEETVKYITYIDGKEYVLDGEFESRNSFGFVTSKTVETVKTYYFYGLDGKLINQTTGAFNFNTNAGYYTVTETVSSTIKTTVYVLTVTEKK